MTTNQEKPNAEAEATPQEAKVDSSVAASVAGDIPSADVTDEENRPEEAEDSAEPEVTDSDEESEAEEETGGSPFQEFFNHFAEHNELTEDHYTKLQDQFGLPKEAVDLYIEGWRIRQEREVKAIHDLAGGEETFNAMCEWVESGGLKAKDAKVYNELRASGDETKIRLAVSLLRDRFFEANGTEPTLVTASGSATNSGDVFRSRDEIVNIKLTRKYKTDKAYAAEIDKKVARSLPYLK